MAVLLNSQSKQNEYARKREKTQTKRAELMSNARALGAFMKNSALRSSKGKEKREVNAADSKTSDHIALFQTI